VRSIHAIHLSVSLIFRGTNIVCPFLPTSNLVR